MTSSWTYEVNGLVFDDIAESKEQAEEWANEAFAEQCQEELSPRNGDTFYQDIFLIHRSLDDDTGDWIELERVPCTVEYTHYHGDHAEHFRQADYI